MLLASSIESHIFSSARGEVWKQNFGPEGVAGCCLRRLGLNLLDQLNLSEVHNLELSLDPKKNYHDCIF